VAEPPLIEKEEQWTADATEAENQRRSLQRSIKHNRGTTRKIGNSCD
jgi:hypothetical protein